MAKVNLDDDYPQISMPVGSSAEVLELGVPLRNVATCCARVQGEGGSHGCPAWRDCDRAFKGDRPRYEVVRIITKEGGIRIYHDKCFMNVRREVELDAQGGFAEVIGGEGDKYMVRGSVKRNKDCPDCARGECTRTHVWDEMETEQTCPDFPLAKDHPELKKFALIAEARQHGNTVRKEKQREHLLTNVGEEPVTVKRGKPA